MPPLCERFEYKPSGRISCYSRRVNNSVNGHCKTRLFWEPLIIFFAVTVACAFIYQVGGRIPVLARHRGALIAVIFVYVPFWWLAKQSRNPIAYGLTYKPLVRGLLVFFGVAVAILPSYAVCFALYYRWACKRAREGVALMRMYTLMCRRFAGSWKATKVHFRGWRDVEQVAVQLIAVAFPEEVFFRGYLHTSYERLWVPRHRLLGGGVGRALIASSLLFALGHVLVDFNPVRLAVFFPSLLFGWMRSASGSVLAPILFHASCNLLSDWLHRAYF